ncbi:hypothetical protein Tco_0655233 [Tanacetum coccineum]|uniref:Uncharacterized protein n=1 Tax=Tanacetum coccineum TaxID=301880 RepID=A0ABQ4X5F3_9ASTR
MLFDFINTAVGDEAVHKELGDIMERAATTASSLEAEQDNDTILGDVNAQTRFEITSIQSIDPPLSRGYTLGSGEDSMKLIGIDEIFPKFAETHNVVAFLEKPEESDGFTEIIDFLQASYVSYALTVNPVIYNTCIENFGEQLPRRDSSLDDAEELLSFQLLLSLKNWRVWGKDFSGRITPLFDTMMVQPIEEMGEDSDNPINSTPIPIIDQPSLSSHPKKHKSSKKVQRQEAEVLDLQKAKDAQAKEIDALKKRIQRLERRKISRPTCLKRLRKVSMSRRVKSSAYQERLGVPEDASKQGRGIEDIDANVDVSLVDETQERQDDDLIFDTGVLDDVEMPVEAKVDGKDEQSTKKLDDSTAGEAVTTAGDDSVFSATNEEITLAQTLIQIKSVKPKVVTTAATTTTTTRPKDKGVVVQRPNKSWQRKQERRTNIQLIESWENTQAMMEADRLLAERLQSKEREELTDEEKSKTVYGT